MNSKDFAMVLENEEFRKIKEAHAKELLDFMLKNSEDFEIVCNTKEVSFNPELPKHISSAFGELIIFALANYTLQSAHFENDNLVFEAGFGEENFGSVVSVPIYAIVQITEQNAPLFINPAATLPKKEKEIKENPFALNPRNQKFMRE
jgi:hypothetical protein